MKVSLKTKVVIVVLLIAFIVAFTSVIVSYNIYADTMDEHYQSLTVNLAKSGAQLVKKEDAAKLTADVMAIYRAHCVDGKAPDFDAFTDSDWETYTAAFEEVKATPAYQSVFKTLITLKEENNADSIYICFMDEKTGKAVYIIDAGYTEDANSPGICDNIEEGNLMLMQQGIFEFPSYITNYPEYGWLSSASSAIRSEDGEVIANAYVDISMNDVMADRQAFLIRLVIFITVAAIALIIVITVLVNRTVVRPINQLSTAAGQFVSEKESGGDSAISKLRIKTGDEIEHLSDSIKQMEKEINTYITDLTSVTAERERIGAELDVAKNIQSSLLPCIFPAFPDREEFDIYAVMTPAKEVGGDFYDFFLVDDDHLAMVMADVSGKGIPAALFMMISKTLIKSTAQTGLCPKAVFEKVNAQLCENNDAQMFVTAWLGIMEISTGKMVCANAGHEYPAIKRKDGSYELYKDKHGFVLAGMEGAKYRQYEMQLNPGDALFVYTDGVAEATDAHNELYGTDRMLAALNSNSHADCRTLLVNVHEDIDRFVGEAPQFDDITMLSIQMKDTGGRHMDKISIQPELDKIPEATAFFESMLEKAEAPMKVIAQTNVAVDEIFSNIARYSGAANVILGCEIYKNEITMRFADNGRPYDPTKTPDPDTTLSAEEREIGGLGIFMVKKTMDEVVYEYADDFNILTLKKKW